MRTECNFFVIHWYPFDPSNGYSSLGNVHYFCVLFFSFVNFICFLIVIRHTFLMRLPCTRVTGPLHNICQILLSRLGYIYIVVVIIFPVISDNWLWKCQHHILHLRICTVFVAYGFHTWMPDFALKPKFIKPCKSSWQLKVHLDGY